MLRSSSKMLPSGELLHRDQEVLPKRCLLHKQGGLQLPGRDWLLQSGQLLRAGILCWVCLLRQGCPLLWSSLVHPLSVYTYICFSLSEWDCSLSEWDGNLSSPSSVSFPNPFAPHFLSVYSLYCHYLDLGHHMDAIFKFANNILNNLRNTGINPLFPLNGKKYRLFHFLGPLPYYFYIFWESNGSSCGRCYVTPIFCSE